MLRKSKAFSVTLRFPLYVWGTVTRSGGEGRLLLQAPVAALASWYALRCCWRVISPARGSNQCLTRLAHESRGSLTPRQGEGYNDWRTSYERQGIRAVAHRPIPMLPPRLSACQATELSDRG